MPTIGSRYREGLTIAVWNSFTGNAIYSQDNVSSAEDHIINRLIVIADDDLPGRDVALIAFIETEVVAIKNGIDEGHIELPPKRVYAMPFPYDVQARKQVLRQIRESMWVDLCLA